MENEIYVARIEGISPLLINRPSEMIIAAKSKERKIDSATPREIAEGKLYKDKDNKIFIPDIYLKNCLVEAGKAIKISGKGSSRATYSKIIGYAVEINPMEIPLVSSEFEVYSVLAVNPNTKGRVMLHRPIFHSWSLDFEIHFDEKEIPQDDLKNCLDIGGRTVGIGDWRPAKKGRFGKLHVTYWQKK